MAIIIRLARIVTIENITLSFPGEGAEEEPPLGVLLPSSFCEREDSLTLRPILVILVLSNSLRLRSPVA